MKKWLRYGCFILGVLIILIMLPSFLYKKEQNHLPLPSHYRKGVYHFHSTFSDGKGTVAEITRAARQLKLDFAIITDHGNPNLLSLKSTSWMNDVLLIGGTELSLNSGHLATAGYRAPDYILPPEPQEAINEINLQRGISFISHPFDDKIPWTDWEIRDFTGIEVFNSYGCAREAGFLKLLIFPLQYVINPKQALLNTLSFPHKNLEKWDSLNEQNRYFAIYASDAHAQLPITKNFKLPFPSYQSMFEVFHTYAKIDQNLSKDPYSSASAIISALKKGHFFNVVEAIAPANGFEYFYLTTDGKIVEMGDTTQEIGGRLIIRVPFDFETRIIVKKNGKIFQAIKHNWKKTREFFLSDPGVYRVEIYASQNRFSRIPWILTNPIFIGMQYSDHSETVPGIKKILMEQKDFFTIETNSLSTGFYTPVTANPDEWMIAFSYRLKKEADKKDFWSALARRSNFDLSSYTGFIFEAKAETATRFWIEFRIQSEKGESWYRHSFRAETAWRILTIPFKKFHLLKGLGKNPDLSKIRSIFFSINNANAYPDSQGILYLKNVSLYGN